MTSTHIDGEYRVTTYDNGSVVRELNTQPRVVTWANAPAEYYWIDVGSFFDRIGAKRLSVLASGDATVQAIIRDVQSRRYVDLLRPDVAPALDILIAKGLIDSTDKAALLSLETTDAERHVRGLPQPA